jgi:hypothetical protein
VIATELLLVNHRCLWKHYSATTAICLFRSRCLAAGLYMPKGRVLSCPEKRDRMCPGCWFSPPNVGDVRTKISVVGIQTTLFFPLNVSVSHQGQSVSGFYLRCLSDLLPFICNSRSLPLYPPKGISGGSISPSVSQSSSSC